MDKDKFLDAFTNLDLSGALALHTAFAQRALRMKPGDAAIIINGRVYGPLADGELFAAEDLRLAEQLSVKSAGVGEMAKKLAKMLPNSTSANVVSELVWRAASVLESTKWRLAGFAKSVSLLIIAAYACIGGSWAGGHVRGVGCGRRKMSCCLIFPYCSSPLKASS